MSGCSALGLEILHKIQTRVCNIIGPDMASWLETLFHHPKVADLSCFYKYVHINCSHERSSLISQLQEIKRSTALAAKFHDNTVEIAKVLF